MEGVVEGAVVVVEVGVEKKACWMGGGRGCWRKRAFERWLKASFLATCW